MTKRKLTRSQSNVWVAGTIAGIGEYFGWGRGVVQATRIIFLILSIITYGLLMLVYIFVSLLISKK